MAVNAAGGSIAFGTGRSRIDWAVAQASKAGCTVCGDGYLLRRAGGRLLVALADGVGSGPHARDAANACLAELAAGPVGGIAELFTAAHARLQGSRGAALAVALIDPGHETVEWAAVGDVEGIICRMQTVSTDSSAVMQKGGTLGVHFPGIYCQSQKFPRQHVLILASDGISRQFRNALPFIQVPPQEWASSCLDEFGRENDDRTILIAAHCGRVE
ncbi:SpoIIE family protein phosphatase [Leisingera sp. SS27]|uniref:SpoIIE family protein phosphatase n=1 Tax=Leisingera sp. SS27 TaxID=2979462 RepID=UPI003FA59FE2